MNFEASLLPVLGGYWLLTHLVPTRTEALRQSGYHIAFRSAVVGLVLFGAAYLILVCVEEWSSASQWLRHPSWLEATFESAAVTSSILGLLGPLTLNRFFDKGKWEERVAGRYGDLVELLIAEAFKHSRLIEVSLQSGKSYIGFPLGNTISRWPEADLALFPLSSGYRDRDTQEFPHRRPMRWRAGNNGCRRAARASGIRAVALGARPCRHWCERTRPGVWPGL